jgi:hypothetical protein
MLLRIFQAFYAFIYHYTIFLLWLTPAVSPAIYKEKCVLQELVMIKKNIGITAVAIQEIVNSFMFIIVRPPFKFLL